MDWLVLTAIGEDRPGLVEVVVTLNGDDSALHDDLERTGASLGIDWTLTPAQPA
ncbi:MAG: hypothetical protein ABUS54_03540 [Actinomycetota bacterium]